MASSVDLSLTNPKIFFVLGVFHWILARIILSTITVFHCSGSFPSIQDWLNKLRILFFKGTWGFGVESVRKAVLSRGCLSVSSQYSLEFVECKQSVCSWVFCFTAAQVDCLSGNCSLRAVMMFMGRVVWSALVVKWVASLLASTFGFIILAVGADPFIFLTCRQICVELISPSLLHHKSHCCFLR